VILNSPTPEKRKAQAQQAAADKVALDKGLARQLVDTYAVIGNNKAWFKGVMDTLAKKHGHGHAEQIKTYMTQYKQELLANENYTRELAARCGLDATGLVENETLSGVRRSADGGNKAREPLT
jgi:hypothetical protein